MVFHLQKLSGKHSYNFLLFFTIITLWLQTFFVRIELTSRLLSSFGKIIEITRWNFLSNYYLWKRFVNGIWLYWVFEHSIKFRENHRKNDMKFPIKLLFLETICNWYLVVFGFFGGWVFPINVKFCNNVWMLIFMNQCPLYHNFEVFSEIWTDE